MMVNANRLHSAGTPRHPDRWRCRPTVIWARIVTVFLLQSMVLKSPGEEPSALDVDNAPAAALARLPEDWQGAEMLLRENFEAMPDGSYPHGWRFTLANPYNQAPDHQVATVRRTRGGGHLMHFKRSIHTRWRAGLTGGRLRLQFDFRRVHAEGEAEMSVGITDRRPSVDAGLGSPVEHGPYVIVTWPAGAGALAAAASTLRFDNTRNQIGKITAAGWHRMVIVADLDRNHYRVSIDGELRGQDVPFFDARWFQDAEQLWFDGREILVDNIHLVHQVGEDPGVQLKRPLQPPRRLIHARRLAAHPRLDGKLDDLAWENAFHTDQFFRPDGKPASESRTECWIGFREDYLYLATQVDVGPEHRQALHREGGELLPESLEVFLDPSFTQQPHLHLKFDAAGNREQIIDRPGWMGGKDVFRPPFPGRWSLATHIEGDRLFAEIRVPWSEVAAHFDRGNGLGAGTQWWGVNIVRGTALGQYASLAPVFDDPRNPHRFAKLAGLDSQITAAVECRVAVRQTLFTGANNVRVNVARGATVESRDLAVELVARAADGTVVRKQHPFTRANPGQRQAIDVPMKISRSGPWSLQASIWPAGQVAVKGLRPLGSSDEVFCRAVHRGTLEARTDHNYYTNEPLARIRGKVWGLDVPAGSRVTLRVRDAQGNVLHDQQQRVDSPEFTLDPFPVRALPLGKMTVELRVDSRRAGQIAATTLPLIRRLAKQNEVKIRWDNMLIVDGEPFFPIYVYRTNVLLAGRLGANALLGQSGFLYDDRPGRVRKLNLAKETRIKLISSEFGTDFLREAPADPRAMRRPILDEGSMLAFYVHDEPQATEAAVPTPLPLHVERAALIREMDPYHPTYFCLMPSWKDTCAYAPIVDAIGHDPYASYLAYHERWVSWSTRMLVAVTEGKQPIWQVLQPFFFKASHEHPSPSDLRHSIWSAVIHGANGIGFWGASGGGHAVEDIRGLNSNRVNWLAAQETVHAVRRLAPVILSEAAVGAGAICDSDYVAVMNKRHDGQLYVFVLNMRSGPEQVTLTLPVNRGKLVNQLDGGGAWSVTDGRCALSLQACQPLVLRYEH